MTKQNYIVFSQNNTPFERFVTQHKPPTAEQEFEWSWHNFLMQGIDQALKSGKTIEQLAKETCWSEEKIRVIIRRGMRDRDKMFLHNQRLIIKFLKGRHSLTSHLQYGDLISEGNLGLNEALKKFNPLLGWKFSTYASNWIKRYLTRAVDDKEQLMRVPLHVHEKKRTIKRAAAQLRLAKKPNTVEAIAKATGMAQHQVEFVFENTRNIVLSIDNKPAGADRYDGISLGDTVRDNQTVSPNEAVEKSEIKAALKEAIRSLTAIQQQILKLKYDQEFSHSQIAGILNISSSLELAEYRKAIRQLRRKMCHYSFL